MIFHFFLILIDFVAGRAMSFVFPAAVNRKGELSVLKTK
jgi:hypothetical protein